MRILFVIKALGAGPGGGAERVLATISTALAERGHHVAVLTFDPAGSDDFYSVGANVGRIRLGIGHTLKRSGMIVTVRRLARIRSVVSGWRPDVTVGFMHSGFVPLALALLGTRIPVIGSERTAYAHYRHRPLERALFRAIAPFLTSMTVNGDDVRRGFPRRVARKMVVLPNPVARARKLADAIGPDEKVLLSVGVLRPEKDQKTLIQAFARIAPRHPRWRLRIVGDGELRQQLNQEVERLELGTRVELPGPSSTIAEEYEHAQLFALPSIYEAFPNSLAEALAHGLPAVGFADCPGTNRLIKPGANGVLVHGGDRIDSLASGLDTLMSSPELRSALGQGGPASVKEFALDAITDRWETVISAARRAARPTPWTEQSRQQ